VVNHEGSGGVVTKIVRKRPQLGARGYGGAVWQRHVTQLRTIRVNAQLHKPVPQGRAVSPTLNEATHNGSNAAYLLRTMSSGVVPEPFSALPAFA